MSAFVYILLPVHNRCEITRSFIGCLKEQTYQNFHLVLLDDGSSDGTADMVREQIASSTILRGNGNWWWAGSLQKGIDWLYSSRCHKDSLVLLINDDTEFDSGFLERGVQMTTSGQDLILKAYVYDREKGNLVDAGVRLDWLRLTSRVIDGDVEADCFSTRGIFMSIHTLMKIGSFYPSLLPHYLSDYEFTIRAKRKGIRFVTDPSISLITPNPAGNVRQMPDNFKDRVKFMFSNKCHRNPIHWLFFVWMAAPWRWKIWDSLLICFKGVYDLSGLSLHYQLSEDFSFRKLPRR